MPRYSGSSMAFRGQERTSAKETNMRRVVMLVVLTMVWAAGLAGCKSSESPIFFTSPSSPFPDVPVPASFTLVNQSTPGLAPATAGRLVEYSYQSTDGLQPIARFFSDQMPRRGWVLQAQSGGSDRVALKYAKAGEVLLIEVSGGSAIRTNTTIRISPATGTAPGQAG
jgi:hypothetical protein